MKKFVWTVMGFTGIVIIVVLVRTIGVIYIQSKASFKIDDNKNVLILGDSQTECAIDDHILSNSVNVSQSACVYMYSYCKLKRFLYHNTSIDTVLLSFHYLPLKNEVYKKWIDEFGYDYLLGYVTLLSRDEISAFSDLPRFLQVIIRIPGDMKNLMKGYIKKTISYKDLGIGGYKMLDRDKLTQDICIRDEKKLTSVGECEEISLYQKKYLLKIADLCKKHHVCLILMSTPTFQPNLYASREKLSAYHQKYLQDVYFIDYSNFALPDSCYGDVEHLNYKGVNIFSNYLKENLVGDVSNLTH